MTATDTNTVEDALVGVVDAAGDGLLTPEEVAPPPEGPVRELRLALVCYGGVSLAIYMHGITKELHKLVLASTAYECDQRANPFDVDDSAHAYWELLREQHVKEHLRTRVVIDILSGTSAGGINAVYLATAIARNRPQDPLRRLWLERGDIKGLLAGPRWLPAFAKVALFLYRSVRHPLATGPPLRGDDMCRWLNEAFDEMDAGSHPQLADRATLIPRGQRLQLFVPITDFTGYDVRIPLDDPAWVSDRTHRHVMRFVHDERGQHQLSPAWNDALAFSARATSSFPGAFPPLSIGDYERDVGGHQLAAEVRETLFPGHFLADQDPVRTHFIDGGVLDNKPFGAALDAIKLRPAATEVDRRLLYIEPDPDARSGGADDGAPPGWLATILDGYAGIPRKEPILDDLNGITRHNGAVERVRDIIETSFDALRDRVVSQIAPAAVTGQEAGVAVMSAQQLSGWREQLTDAADDEAGFSRPTYLRLRMRSVIEDYASLIAARRRYPTGSTHAEFVRLVLREEAVSRGLLERRPEVTGAQQELLDSMDIGYEDRHLRFLIAALSWWYGRDDDAPAREQVDQAKYELYRRLDELQDVAIALTEDRTVSDLIGQVFSKEAIDDALQRGATAREVAADRRDTLERLSRTVTSLVGAQLARVRAGIDADVAQLTATWTPAARRELLVRHLAFRFWDVLVYPVQALSGVNERDHVEVMRISPHEATTIVDDPRKKNLKGLTLGHFGAFFSREGRENDYLWGRLDGADRLVALLQTQAGGPVAPPSQEACRPAFEAILRDEEDALKAVSGVVERVRGIVGGSQT